MVVELACTCDGLPPHSHVYRVGIDPAKDDTTTITMIMDPYDVRIWVDWKALLREFVIEADEVRREPSAVADGAIFWEGRDAEDFEREARWEADHPGGVITPEERASMDTYEGEGI